MHVKNEKQSIFVREKTKCRSSLVKFNASICCSDRFVPTKDNWRRSKLSKEIDGMLRVLIHKKEKAMKCGEGEHEDLLGLMLRSNEQAQSNANDTKFKGLTVQEVMEECKLFYFAGHETTSDLLTWTMILLSMHQSWQYQAREEVHQICGRTLPNYDSISQLKIVSSSEFSVS